MSTNKVNIGDFITIAYSNITIRCQVIEVSVDFTKVNRPPKYLLRGLSFPFMDWVGQDCVIDHSSREAPKTVNPTVITKVNEYLIDNKTNTKITTSTPSATKASIWDSILRK